MKFIVGSVFLLVSAFLLFLFTSQPDITTVPVIAPTSVPASATPLPVPLSYQIKTTFVPQAPQKLWSQPWQDACEEASLLTLKYYYDKTTPGIPVMVADLEEIFKYEENSGWGHDVDLQKMSLIAQNYFNLSPKIVKNPTVETIKNFLRQDLPVIITANGKTLFKENKNFKDGGPWYHSLVILGYDDRLKQFIVHDVGTQHGAYFKYSYAVLMDSIHDLPPSGDKIEINSGEKSILVLLQ